MVILKNVSTTHDNFLGGTKCNRGGDRAKYGYTMWLKININNK